MISSTSGLLIDTTEDGTDGKCCPGRDTDAPALGTWNLQIGQSQKSFYTESNMSIESLSTFFITSGEYISIHSKPWIISTTKEKEVTTLQSVVSVLCLHFLLLIISCPKESV